MAANPQLLGVNLKSTRKDRRLTLQQAAERAHVSVRTISKWESGEIRNPNWDNLERYARVLKVDLLELLDDPDALADDHPSFREQLEQIIEDQRRIESKLDAVLDLFTDAEQLAAAIDRRREGDESKPAGDRPRLPGVRPPAKRAAQKRSA